MISFDLINKQFEIKKSVVSKNSIIFHQISDLDFIKSSEISYQIILEENAQYQICIMLCDVKEATIELEVEALGDQSSFEIVFLYALSSDQKITIVTKQKHIGQKTNSRLYARGIVKNNALIHHRGLILIEENGQKTESTLEHKVLVFGTKTQAVLIPSIEVLNNDVQCFHGAAVGQFQQEHVWYLKSRGFDEQQVYSMLLRSFFSEYIEKFDQHEKILESLCQKIVRA